MFYPQSVLIALLCLVRIVSLKWATKCLTFYYCITTTVFHTINLSIIHQLFYCIVYCGYNNDYNIIHIWLIFVTNMYVIIRLDFYFCLFLYAHFAFISLVYQFYLPLNQNKIFCNNWLTYCICKGEQVSVPFQRDHRQEWLEGMTPNIG